MTYSRYVLKMEPWKLETVLRTGMFPIVQNDFHLAVSLAKLQACKLHSLKIWAINHENL